MYKTFKRECLVHLFSCLMSLNNDNFEEKVVEIFSKQQHQLKSVIPSSLPKTITFTGKGNQHQFDTLQEIDTIVQGVEAYVQGFAEGDPVDTQALLEPLASCRKIIKDRVKILRIADQGGWLAVKKYQGAIRLGEDAEDNSELCFKHDKLSNFLKTHQ